ncbi:MAG TPA: hypothetical protein VGD83_37110 [Streptosporangiaceae bacterium]
MDIATEEMGHDEMTATIVCQAAGRSTRHQGCCCRSGGRRGARRDGSAAGHRRRGRRAAAQAAVGRGWSSSCCLPCSTRLMRASWAGNCALPPSPASPLFDSYLPLVFLGFRSDRLTGLP